MRSSRGTVYIVIFATAALHREAWGMLLAGQPGITVAGVAGEVTGIAPLVQPKQPIAILVDARPPQPDLASRLKAAAPGCGILFLVDSYDLSEIILLLRAGATGCLSRDASVGDLARAVIAAAREEIVLPPDIAGRALAALARGEPVPSGSPQVQLIEPLSEREVEVLRLLAQGLTNKDMAQTLMVSVRTVEAHLRSIYGKLGVRSRTEAALWAVKHGPGALD